MGLGKQPLQKPQKIWNIDNTENKAGLITHHVNLDVQTQNIHRMLCFLITNIGQEDIVLGYPWLSTFKPQFNWTSAVINKKALPVVIRSVHQQEHRLLPDFLLVPSRKAVQVAQVHKSNIGLLFNINFNNINLFALITKYKKRINLLHR